MKLIILNGKSRFSPKDLKRLNKHGAIFYEEKGNKLEDVKELWEKDDFVLGVQPGWIDGSWEGLKWEKLQEMRGLKGLCLSTTAYEWAPFHELAKKNIPVCNVPGKSTDAVGEYYVFLMIALLRKLPGVIKNNWNFTYGPDLLGADAKGLTAGIIGLGKIGKKIADLCNGFGMTVIYWSKSKKDCSYSFSEIDNLCKSADVIFLTTMADESTKNLLDEKRIDLLKKTAILLTPVNSMVYAKHYVLDKIAKNELGGLGYEGSNNEKIEKMQGNVFPAPELGYFTSQTLDNESRIMTDSMISILEGRPVNVVNL
jgi:lactate dehydrogenase-like 2-hydroxyacid dehydrogenase